MRSGTDDVCQFAWADKAVAVGRFYARQLADFQFEAHQRRVTLSADPGRERPSTSRSVAGEEKHDLALVAYVDDLLFATSRIIQMVIDFFRTPKVHQ